MKRVLLTGMSGVGKSSTLARLAERGYDTLDADGDAFTREVRTDSGTERLWIEDRIEAVLASSKADVLFVGGTVRNQVRFYPRFDEIVLLSAPASVIVERLTGRSNNPYGKQPEQLAETLQLLKTVEP